MSDRTYWWSRYGDFDPGMGVYPHMGQVIACYRLKRGFRTQQDLAIALGYSKRTIEELEGTLNVDMPDSIERRQVLAKLLRIPPALLALDWRFMAYEQESKDRKASFVDAVSLKEEDIFTLYEDILILGWGYLFNGGPAESAKRIDERLQKLIMTVKNAPTSEKEQWQTLLCRFYQLSTRFAQRGMNKKQALSDANHAVDIATELHDTELIACAYFRRVRVHLEHRNVAVDDVQRQKHLEFAKTDVDIALGYVERERDRISGPLKGNIYLIAAEVYAIYAGHDEMLRKKCEKWQERAGALVYRGGMEDTRNFLKLNTTALHHERAKTMLQFHRLQDARSELTTAWKTLTPDLLS